MQRPRWAAASTAVWATLAVAPWTWFLVRRWTPILDLVAIGLPLLAFGLIVVWTALVFRRRSTLSVIGLASVTVWGYVAIVGPWTPRSSPAPTSEIDVVSFNTGFRGGAADTLLALDPDVLVVQELPPAQHQRLAAAYPHDEVTAGVLARAAADHPKVGAYSRWDLTVLDAPPDFPGLRLRVDHPEHPFILYALHIAKPALFPQSYATSFGHHQDIVELVRDLGRAEILPLVVAGDLNAPDRAADYALLDHDLRDVVRTNWAAPTSRKRVPGWRLLLLRIDHIFVSEDWCGARGGRVEIGRADHLAVRATVGPCPD